MHFLNVENTKKGASVHVDSRNGHNDEVEITGRSLEARICSYRQKLLGASFGRPEELCDGN